MKLLALTVAATMLAFPIAGTCASSPWYVGLAGGASSLRPETTNSPFEIDSSVSFGGGVFIGHHYNTRFSFEAGYNYLGAATLSGESGKNDIEYTALSAGALMYVLGDSVDIAQRNGFTGYVRLGLNSMSNSTTIPLEQEDNLGIWAGVGVEWPISQNLNLRAEIASFDGDAQTARLAVLYRLRSNAQSASTVRTPQTPAVVAQTPSQQEAEPEQPASTPTQQNTAPTSESTLDQTTLDTVQPSSDDNENSCVAPASNEPIDAQGCALFGGLLNGVAFASGTGNLTEEASPLLDQLGNNLLRYDAIVIEIQAHTESFGNQARANEIAKQRTIAIARYLVGRGVPVNRLKARAFGHSRPLAPDDTVAGRQQNNRIELRVLP